MRTHTLPVERINDDGRVSTRITVQRCCNGCGHQIGDVTPEEILLSIHGAPLPDVRDECPWCAQFLAEEERSA